MKTNALVFLLLFSVRLAAGDISYTIDTFAGSDVVGDNGPALAAQVNDPHGMAIDRSGNVYIADTDSQRIRKISPSGIITTIAGNGHPGYRGDGGPAERAQLNYPYGVALDEAGNLFVADFYNNRVRKIRTDGIIVTVAGNGKKGSNGDGGPAESAQLMSPRNVAVGPGGELYISEFDGHRIRQVSPDGIITTVAGTGIAGLNVDPKREEGIAAGDAQLHSPAGLAVDRAGVIYFADSANHMIRKISGKRVFTVFDGRKGTVLVGPQGIAALATPTGIALDPFGYVCVVDGTNSVRRIASNGPATELKLIAGKGESRYEGDGGLATSAKLFNPRDLVFDSQGNLYIAEFRHIRKVNSTGIIGTYAGDAYTRFVGDGAQAAYAQMNAPRGLALDNRGDLLVADTGINRIRRVTPQGMISTVAQAALLGLNQPGAVAADPAGNLIIADSFNHKIIKITPQNLKLDVAGTGTMGLGADNAAAIEAQLNTPQGVCTDSSGRVYIADTANHRVVRVNTDGTLGTVAGNGSGGFAGDDGRAPLAQLNQPQAITMDAGDNLYIADTSNQRIRKVSGDGVITTIAGVGVEGFGGDEGKATSARLWNPRGVAVDGDGNLYIADTWNHRIRKVTPDGVIHTIAGSEYPGWGGDGGPAVAAQLNYPSGIVVDGNGNVFFSDTLNNRVRKLTPGTGEAPPPPLVTIEATVINAASLLAGPVAPGEVVAILGGGIGPETGAGSDTNSGAPLETTLAHTQVLFDGRTAPLFFVQKDQIRAQVPYEVAGRNATQLEIQYKGETRLKIMIPVADTAPALFTVAGGAGLILANNQDGSLNSETSPAPRGSVVTIYATGEGQTKPAGISGQPPATPSPQPVLPVSLMIGGNTAEIIQTVEAPGMVGVLQIDARVPGGFAPAGMLPVVLTVGNASTQSGVTIAVR